tara:strand:- start:160 stop:447 length:288 start_codon:yes stop_codon:yes gene_type:complete
MLNNEDKAVIGHVVVDPVAWWENAKANSMRKFGNLDWATQASKDKVDKHTLSFTTAQEDAKAAARLRTPDTPDDEIPDLLADYKNRAERDAAVNI